MQAILDFLAHLIGARMCCDDRGPFIRGFGSKAIAARAAEIHPPGSRQWYESEGAKLILRVVDEDKAGARSLPHFLDDDYGVEDEIIRRAKLLALCWAVDVRELVPR